MATAILIKQQLMLHQQRLIELDTKYTEFTKKLFLQKKQIIMKMWEQFYQQMDYIHNVSSPSKNVKNENVSNHIMEALESTVHILGSLKSGHHENNISMNESAHNIDNKNIINQPLQSQQLEINNNPSNISSVEPEQYELHQNDHILRSLPIEPSENDISVNSEKVDNNRTKKRTLRDIDDTKMNESEPPPKRQRMPALEIESSPIINADNMFEAANMFRTQKEYQKAIDIYEQMLHHKIQSPEVIIYLISCKIAKKEYETTDEQEKYLHHLINGYNADAHNADEIIGRIDCAVHIGEYFLHHDKPQYARSLLWFKRGLECSNSFIIETDDGEKMVDQAKLQNTAYGESVIKQLLQRTVESIVRFLKEDKLENYEIDEELKTELKLSGIVLEEQWLTQEIKTIFQIFNGYIASNSGGRPLPFSREEYASTFVNYGTYMADIQQKPGEAIKWYKRALECDKNDWVTHLNLAELYEKKNKRRSAVDHYQSFIDTATNETDDNVKQDIENAKKYIRKYNERMKR